MRAGACKSAYALARTNRAQRGTFFQMTHFPHSGSVLKRLTQMRRPPRARLLPAPRSRLRLQERDLQMLRFLWAHTLASRSQLQELFFRSTPRANERLRLLFDNQLVRRHTLALSPMGCWAEQAVYGLGAAALPLLAERFDMAIESLGAQKRGQAVPLFARHALATVDIGLSLRCAAASSPSVEMQVWLGENEARHHYEWRPPGGDWKSETFKPDSFMRLRFQGPSSLSAFLECDLGHTSARGWEGKIAAYRRYLDSGLFAQTYGEAGFLVLCVTTGERRREHLRELARERGALFLRLATFADVGREGALASIWHSPHREGAAPLDEGGVP